MTAKKLREKYLQFFKEKGHAILPSASLIPENDPTVLFTTAGMQPMVPFLLGEEHPAGKRLANAQKCIRTGDIDEVGDNRHLTFFEMLGNWSLGDYFKKEAIGWSFDFLTSPKWLGLDPKRLYVTVFGGEGDISSDTDSVTIWQENFKKVGIIADASTVGIREAENTRIFMLGKNDNWWGLAFGGPCGPSTEMFYDVYPERGFENKSHEQLVNDGRLIEIWNDVFLVYDRKSDGSLKKLRQQNVDTGMGVERTVAVLNGKNNVYETELFSPLIDKIKETSEDKEDEKSIRIIADHIKTAVFILADPSGVAPLNIGQGYVLRRLIRRAIRYAKKISMANNLAPLAEIIINIYKEQYPEAFRLAWPRIRPGGYFIADNLLWHGRVMTDDSHSSTQAIRELTKLIYTTPDAKSVIVPLRDGLSVSLKTSRD